MTVVYEASNNVEAHMILHLLQQAGIAGQIDGEHLQGAMGELPAMGNVRVRVEPQDADEARQIIVDWESIQLKETPPSKPEPPRQKATYFVTGVLLTAFVLYGLFRFPGTSEGFDYNGDGKLDEIYYWQGDVTSKVEYDRNRDGKIDSRSLYSLAGVFEESEADNDFDGSFEQKTTYIEGIPILTKTDSDGDGKADIHDYYRNGIYEKTKFLNPLTGHVVKIIYYDAYGKLIKSEIDSDNDGILDLKTTYDKYEEPIERSAL
jgi:hypothetical protein